MRHPAHAIPFDDLLAGLRSRVDAGLVSERRDGELGLFCYTKSAVYDETWDEFTSVARGIVLDLEERRIVAAPFPKFHNLGEGGRLPPSERFDAFEKLDGSLIVAFEHRGRWRTTTKGAFESDQAVAARKLIPFDKLSPGNTYLFEFVGPSNKIVIRYPKDECKLLAIYDADGEELTRDEIEGTELGDVKLAKRLHGITLAELVAKAETLPKDEEGWVLLFDDGTRLKLKGSAYRRVHAAISGLSPLSTWEAMQAGEDEIVRRELPEEFLEDFDAMRSIIAKKLSEISEAAERSAESLAGLSGKEIAERLPSIPEPERSFIFDFVKGKKDSQGTVKRLYRAVRPNGNALPGYVPSRSFLRFSKEADA
jgi:RNA ligase